ncbi:DUF2007 domain-containing protein [Parahaliea maris]|uniref:DUF2007 domain-containing protein n=1 Tax=Parahaliea maris TaxID=2716870 RepID=A0A5C8ZPI6_9GAMM|nr:DUF2007 domain-containing protein [Parahaliea maris]TXS89539.1 DUF2007 domain-containing protein [Parahaliea maris]
MKQVYAHPQLMMVSQMRSLLDQAGIASQIRNEYAAGAAGELAPIDTWPELWVERDADTPRAKDLIAELLTRQDQPDWHCKHCGNDSPASFDFCWQCGTNSSRA